jgi:hypothetical protein
MLQIENSSRFKSGEYGGQSVKSPEFGKQPLGGFGFFWQCGLLKNLL